MSKDKDGKDKATQADPQTAETTPAEPEAEGDDEGDQGATGGGNTQGSGEPK